MSLPKEPRQWTKQSTTQSFLVSTDNSLLSVPAINAAFASEDMYWVKPCADDTLQAIVENSFCFGLYKVSDNSDNSNSTLSSTLEQVGFARLITDRFTFAYLTDVYVLPPYQGLGLGGWILDCVDELMQPLPHLRWFMLRTASETSKRAYERRFGMSVLDNGDPSLGGINMGRKGKGNMV